MRILFLTFYYEPDLCAGSFRATALVKALLKQMPAGTQVDVLTTQPNRYNSFSPEATEDEGDQAVTIRRVALPSHQSGMRDQSRAFLTYARFVRGQVKGREYDLVIGTSSRLMTAVLAAHVARFKEAALYLDIRDIFVDTMADVLPKLLAMITAPVLKQLESFAIHSANKVNLISKGFLEYFRSRYPAARYSFFSNGVDDAFVHAQPVGETPAENRPVEVFYAGNIGEGQGLHSILPGLAKELDGRANFSVVGDGGRFAALKAALEHAGCTNVTLHAPVDRNTLVRMYQDADVLFMHLNDYAAFRKVLPSKIFEYAALGKPIWAGVAGYAAAFTRTHVSNAAVFAPCDVAQAVLSFANLDLVTRPRSEFVEAFAREAIMDKMAADILSLLPAGR